MKVYTIDKYEPADGFQCGCGFQSNTEYRLKIHGAKDSYEGKRLCPDCFLESLGEECLIIKE